MFALAVRAVANRMHQIENDSSYRRRALGLVDSNPRDLYRIAIERLSRQQKTGAGKIDHQARWAFQSLNCGAWRQAGAGDNFHHRPFPVGGHSEGAKKSCGISMAALGVRGWRLRNSRTRAQRSQQQAELEKFATYAEKGLHLGGKPIG